MKTGLRMMNLGKIMLMNTIAIIGTTITSMDVGINISIVRRSVP